MSSRTRAWFDQFSVLGAGLVVAELALVAFLLWGLYEYRGATDARGESVEIVVSTDSVRIALLDAQAGSRGYLVTGAAPFREQFQAAHDAVHERFDLLEAQVEGDATLEVVVRGARSAGELALELMARSVAEREGENFDLMAAGALELEIRELRDGAHAALRTVHDTESARLEERSSRADRFATYNAVAAVGLALVMPVAVGWFFIAIRRSQEAEALWRVARAREEFVGFVSHELRAPMAIIAGNVRLLAADAPEGDPGEALGHIADASARMESILGTLLTLTEAEGGARLEIEPLLVHRVANRMARLHRAQFPGRQVEVETEGEIPPALGDVHAVEQVLVNLLSNAEKYGEPSMPIAVRVSPVDDAVRVSVTNRGTTLPAEDVARMFEPFVRGNGSGEGLGLGLTVCQRLVAAQHGAMSGEVEDGGNVTFWFTLPVARMDATDAT